MGKARPVGFPSKIHQEVLVHGQASLLSVHVDLQHDRAFPARGRERSRYRQANHGPVQEILPFTLLFCIEEEAFSLTPGLPLGEGSGGPVAVLARSSAHVVFPSSQGMRPKRSAGCVRQAGAGLAGAGHPLLCYLRASLVDTLGDAAAETRPGSQNSTDGFAPPCRREGSGSPSKTPALRLHTGSSSTLPSQGGLGANCL